MKKIKIISDINKKSKKIRSFVSKEIKKNKLNISNLTIVIGGDGFMLKTLKKNNKCINFYGINSGNYGFLMNKFSKKNFLNNLKSAKLVTISPLEMNAINKFNKSKKIIAVNEVSILRQSRQAAYLSIKSNKRNIISKLISDGVLVSTPAGSTAYNLSVHGPILSLDSKKLAISPISAFRPRRWKSKIVSNKSKIVIKNLDPGKRPVSAVADNIEIRNCLKILVSINHKKKFNLLYDRNRSLHKKIQVEQIRKEFN